MQPLFLESELAFEKSAAETQLPEDPNAWPHEILQELYKQAPYVADFSPHVVMEKVDGEQGYGLGHVEITNQTEIQSGASSEAMASAGVRQVRVPVVIQDCLLSPFDLLITDDSKVLPLTEPRLRAAIFRPQPFDVTSRTPGDQSMIGQLYPPYRQGYGFGGGGVSMNVGMGKEGSALEQYLTKTADAMDDYLKDDKERQVRFGKKTASGDARPGMLDEFIQKNASVKSACDDPKMGKLPKKAVMKKVGSLLKEILPTINESDRDAFMSIVSDPAMQPFLMKNAAAVTNAIQLIVEAPEPVKFAEYFPSIVKADVAQLRRTDTGYLLKTANHAFWSPLVQQLDRGQAVQRFGEKVVLAADLSGAATLAEGEGVSENIEHDSDMQGAGPITEAGLYKVQTPDGQEAIGYVIPNLIDVDGTVLPLALFTNGTQATVQGDIVGLPVEGEGVDLPSADVPSGRGVFASQGAGGVQATIPLTISASAAGMGEGEPTTYRAESFDGQSVVVSVQPNIQTVVGTEDGKMLVPAHWQWLPLAQADEIALESQEDGLGKAASVRRSFASVELVSNGSGTFSFRGPHVEKLAHDAREAVGMDDAMFLLAGLGVDQDYGVRKLAEATTGSAPVRVRVGRSIKLASDEIRAARREAAAVMEQLPTLRQPLFKEALSLGNPESVDVVLSLGFINPENITTFIGYLPMLEDAQTKLCDILLASRLGDLIDTPEGAAERAVRSVEAVLEGLKALAFQSN